MKLRVLDLFSGIGGLSLGLERTGRFETVAFSEIDPYASKVLRKWWPDVPNFNHGIVGLNSLLRRVRTASRQASRARISHSLERAPDLPAPARDSFGHLCEPFAWFDPGSRSWRTWQRCLVEGWETFSDTWPRSGMTRNGIAYRRAPLVPLTGETASGSLLPTPEASNTKAKAMRSGGRAPRSSAPDTDCISRDQGMARDSAERTRGRYADRGCSGARIRNPDRQGLAVGEGFGGDTREEFAPSVGTGWWAVEPDVGRVADGVPARVDRLRCLGNSVVPQVVEFVGHTLIPTTPTGGVLGMVAQSDDLRTTTKPST